MDITDRTVFIAGATSGIGLAAFGAQCPELATRYRGA
jgi:NAD(P)-dependent dehydrogenase (short-subunit alcohol dehydrogenase family)